LDAVVDAGTAATATAANAPYVGAGAAVSALLIRELGGVGVAASAAVRSINPAAAAPATAAVGRNGRGTSARRGVHGPACAAAATTTGSRVVARASVPAQTALAAVDNNFFQTVCKCRATAAAAVPTATGAPVGPNCARPGTGATAGTAARAAAAAAAAGEDGVVPNCRTYSPVRSQATLATGAGVATVAVLTGAGTTRTADTAGAAAATLSRVCGVVVDRYAVRTISA